MKGLLQGLPHVVVYLDDNLLTGVNDEEHLCVLAQYKSSTKWNS